jgi:hypothetical protein
VSTHFLDAIDWQRPWLDPLRDLGRLVAQSSDWRSTLDILASESGLSNHRGLPVHFVPQAGLPDGVAYESFISTTGGVPTRENLHDFFNALIWLTFPRIKAQLNAMQAAEIEKTGAASAAVNGRGGTVRGKIRDAATIFDENAAFLVVSDEALLDALRAHRWHEAFLARRNAFGRECEIYLFGHALMEKLVRPYKAITAHVWPIPTDSEYFEASPVEKLSWLDNTVANQLAVGLTTSCFTPMPVLGVPGWWTGQDDDFYEDTAVFRPKRPGR